MIKRYMLFLLLVLILSACSGMIVETSHSRFVTKEEAQKAVDFKLKLPHASHLVNEPLIEINEPPVGYVNGNENIRLWTNINLYYYAKSGQPDEEIRVIQSLSPVRNLYIENYERIKIKGNEVHVLYLNKHDVYFWKDEDIFIEVWIYSQQLQNDAMQIIEELLLT